MKKLLLSTLIACAGTTGLFAQDFTEGNLVLLRIPHDEATSGGTSTTNGNGALPMFLDEWNPNCIGTNCGVIKTVALPTEETTISGITQYRVTGNGSSSATEHISRSVDGRYLVVQGYSIPTGTNVHYQNAPYSTIKPSFALIDYAGNINSKTRITNDIINADDGKHSWMRAAVSYDGTGVWFGTAGSKGGHYVPVGNETTSTYIGGGYTWTIHLAGKKILLGRSNQIQRVGPTVDLPKTTGQTTQSFSITPASPDDTYSVPGAIGMVALENKIGQKVIYVCDANASPGIKKYLMDESTNTLTYKGRIATSALPLSGGVTSIVGRVIYEADGTTFKNVELFTIGSGTNITATSDAGRLVKIVDAAKFDETINASSSLLKNFAGEVIDGKKYFVRSLAWAPIKESVLPIKLDAFKASQTIDGIKLNWTTVSELNNNYFEILRSEDGQNFEVVGTVKGSGTSSTKQTYSFTDFNVSNGLYYYQLKQVDFDGKSETNSPIPVKFSLQKESFTALLIANNQVKIKLTAQKAQKTTVVINDMLGRVLLKKDLNLNAGINEFDFDLSKHKSPFIIKIYLDGKTIAKKLIN